MAFFYLTIFPLRRKRTKQADEKMFHLNQNKNTKLLQKKMNALIWVKFILAFVCSLASKLSYIGNRWHWCWMFIYRLKAIVFPRKRHFTCENKYTFLRQTDREREEAKWVRVMPHFTLITFHFQCIGFFLPASRIQHPLNAYRLTTCTFDVQFVDSFDECV